MDESLELLFISKEKNNVWFNSQVYGMSSEIKEHIRFGDEPISHISNHQMHRDVLITTDAKYYDKNIAPWYKINYYIYSDIVSYDELYKNLKKWYEKNVDKYINVKHRNITINLTSCTLYKDFPIVVANPIDNETYESLLKVVNSVKYPDGKNNYGKEAEDQKTEKTLIDSIFSLIENNTNSRGGKIKFPYTRVYVDDNRSKLSVHIFDSGNIVSHFKRKELTEEELKENPNKYLYKLIGIGNHTETNEQMVIYEACYGDKETYCRPADMFFSKVDRQKYPNAKQTFRFELADESEAKNVL